MVNSAAKTATKKTGVFDCYAIVVTVVAKMKTIFDFENLDLSSSFMLHFCLIDFLVGGQGKY